MLKKIFITKLRCNQCETKVNVTRLENDPCYNNPLSDNFYCDGANMTTCYASVSSYYHKKGLGSIGLMCHPL